MSTSTQTQQSLWHSLRTHPIYGVLLYGGAFIAALTVFVGGLKLLTNDPLALEFLANALRFTIVAYGAYAVLVAVAAAIEDSSAAVTTLALELLLVAVYPVYALGETLSDAYSFSTYEPGTTPPRYVAEGTLPELFATHLTTHADLFVLVAALGFGVFAVRCLRKGPFWTE